MHISIEQNKIQGDQVNFVGTRGHLLGTRGPRWSFAHYFLDLWVAGIVVNSSGTWIWDSGMYWTKFKVPVFNPCEVIHIFWIWWSKIHHHVLTSTFKPNNPIPMHDIFWERRTLVIPTPTTNTFLLVAILDELNWNLSELQLQVQRKSKYSTG